MSNPAIIIAGLLNSLQPGGRLVSGNTVFEPIQNRPNDQASPSIHNATSCFLLILGIFCVQHYTPAYRPPTGPKGRRRPSIVALRFKQDGVAGLYFTGSEDRRVDSRALPVLLNDAL